MTPKIHGQLATVECTDRADGYFPSCNPLPVQVATRSKLPCLPSTPRPGRPKVTTTKLVVNSACKSANKSLVSKCPTKIPDSPEGPVFKSPAQFIGLADGVGSNKPPATSTSPFESKETSSLLKDNTDVMDSFGKRSQAQPHTPLRSSSKTKVDQPRRASYLPEPVLQNGRQIAIRETKPSHPAEPMSQDRNEMFGKTANHQAEPLSRERRRLFPEIHDLQAKPPNKSKYTQREYNIAAAQETLLIMLDRGDRDDLIGNQQRIVDRLTREKPPAISAEPSSKARIRQNKRGRDEITQENTSSMFVNGPTIDDMSDVHDSEIEGIGPAARKRRKERAEAFDRETAFDASRPRAQLPTEIRKDRGISIEKVAKASAAVHSTFDRGKFGPIDRHTRKINSTNRATERVTKPPPRPLEKRIGMAAFSDSSPSPSPTYRPQKLSKANLNALDGEAVHIVED